MDIKEASSMLAALAQSTRLQASRLLVGHEPGGLPAGDIARKLGIPQNTSSTHLAILVNAGLAGSTRNGRAEICAPLIAALTPCCAATPA